MFTGIVTAIGTVENSQQLADLRVRVACPYDPALIAIGASIACSGACMTVVERGGVAGDAWFAVDVSGESVSKTAPGMWEAGAPLNLETALKLGDELGGHIVTGHVDAVGTVDSVEEVAGSHTVTIRAPAELAPYIAPKGSITVDGVSLTVNTVADHADGACSFTLNIISHTWEVTTLGNLASGSAVNLEIDVLARYLMRMESLRG